jgi:hypothetical protein
MPWRVEELDRRILRILSEDLDSLDSILLKMTTCHSAVPESADLGRIQGRLSEVLQEDLISGYLLHAEPPFVIPIKVCRISEPWFTITVQR